MYPGPTFWNWDLACPNKQHDSFSCRVLDSRELKYNKYLYLCVGPLEHLSPSTSASFPPPHQAVFGLLYFHEEWDSYNYSFNPLACNQDKTDYLQLKTKITYNQDTKYISKDKVLTFSGLGRLTSSY